MKLFLDDERKVSSVTWVELPLGPWTIVRSYKEFVEWISKNGLPEFISFDHDLAEEHYPWHHLNAQDYADNKISYYKYKEKTGFDAAVWLIAYCMASGKALPKYAIHTMNSVGARNIGAVLQEFNLTGSIDPEIARFYLV